MTSRNIFMFKEQYTFVLNQLLFNSFFLLFPATSSSWPDVKKNISGLCASESVLNRFVIYSKIGGTGGKGVI